MTCLPDARLERRYCFVIEAADLPDALIRALTPFAVQSARLVSVATSVGDGVAHIRIEAEGLDGVRAETLRHRLDGLPVVRSVALGWRVRAEAA